MAIREVLKMGDPRLLEIAEAGGRHSARRSSKACSTICGTPCRISMAPVLRRRKSGSGLRVVIFGIEANPRYPDAEPVPFTVLINPAAHAARRGDGGGLGGLPVGARHARPGAALSAAALHRRRCRRARRSTAPSSDFHARVVQHEVDHLDGILYPRRIRDLTKFGFTDALFPGQELVDD